MSFCHPRVPGKSLHVQETNQGEFSSIMTAALLLFADRGPRFYGAGRAISRPAGRVPYPTRCDGIWKFSRRVNSRPLISPALNRPATRTALSLSSSISNSTEVYLLISWMASSSVSPWKMRFPSRQGQVGSDFFRRYFPYLRVRRIEDGGLAFRDHRRVLRHSDYVCRDACFTWSRLIHDGDPAFGNDDLHDIIPAYLHVEGSAHGPDQAVAGAHRQRPVCIFGNREMRFTAGEDNITFGAGVTDPDEAVGVEDDPRCRQAGSRKNIHLLQSHRYRQNLRSRVVKDRTRVGVTRAWQDPQARRTAGMPALRQPV